MNIWSHLRPSARNAIAQACEYVSTEASERKRIVETADLFGAFANFDDNVKRFIDELSKSVPRQQIATVIPIAVSHSIDAAPNRSKIDGLSQCLLDSLGHFEQRGSNSTITIKGIFLDILLNRNGATTTLLREKGFDRRRIDKIAQQIWKTTSTNTQSDNQSSNSNQ